MLAQLASLPPPRRRARGRLGGARRARRCCPLSSRKPRPRRRSTPDRGALPPGAAGLGDLGGGGRAAADARALAAALQAAPWHGVLGALTRPRRERRRALDARVSAAALDVERGVRSCVGGWRRAALGRPGRSVEQRGARAAASVADACADASGRLRHQRERVVEAADDAAASLRRRLVRAGICRRARSGVRCTEAAGALRRAERRGGAAGAGAAAAAGGPSAVLRAERLCARSTACCAAAAPAAPARSAAPSRRPREIRRRPLPLARCAWSTIAWTRSPSRRATRSRRAPPQHGSRAGAAALEALRDASRGGGRRAEQRSPTGGRARRAIVGAKHNETSAAAAGHRRGRSRGRASRRSGGAAECAQPTGGASDGADGRRAAPSAPSSAAGARAAHRTHARGSEATLQSSSLSGAPCRRAAASASAVGVRRRAEDGGAQQPGTRPGVGGGASPDRPLADAGRTACRRADAAGAGGLALFLRQEAARAQGEVGARASSQIHLTDGIRAPMNCAASVWDSEVALRARLTRPARRLDDAQNVDALGRPWVGAW